MIQVFELHHWRDEVYIPAYRPAKVSKVRNQRVSVCLEAPISFFRHRSNSGTMSGFTCVVVMLYHAGSTFGRVLEKD